MRAFIFISILFFARIASAQVLINEVQISPIGERFIELYNSGSADVDLTGWYLQRKTATGNSFNSLVTSTQLNGKSIRANGYFLITRSSREGADLVLGGLTLTESNTVRMRDAQGNDVDQAAWGSIEDGKSYQKMSTGDWVVATPTPGASNSSVQAASDAPASPQNDQGAAVNNEAVSTTAANNVSHFPVEPQIFTKVTAQAQTVSVGAAATFTGRVWGLKKEPIENARMTWTFGDGARAEGSSVAHTYYYPGEYTVVLDASSGYYAASDRVRIVAVVSTLALRTGGDEAHSFVAIENRGNDELDLSEWQVFASGKTFMLPKNTLIGAHKTLTLASEVTGLVTPIGVVAALHFPNGSAVSLQEDAKIITANTKPVVATGEPVRGRALRAPVQTATALDALPESRSGEPHSSNDTLWMWYVGVAFLGVFAALGLRFARGDTLKPGTLTADDFDITDEDEDKKDDLF